MKNLIFVIAIMMLCITIISLVTKTPDTYTSDLSAKQIEKSLKGATIRFDEGYDVLAIEEIVNPIKVR